MELINVSNGSISLNEKAYEIMKRIHENQIQIARDEMELKEVKQAIQNVMEANGIKSFENDLVKITYKGPSVRKSIDTNALKEQGLYDMFLKETPVKASTVWTWK